MSDAKYTCPYCGHKYHKSKKMYDKHVAMCALKNKSKAEILEKKAELESLPTHTELVGIVSHLLKKIDRLESKVDEYKLFIDKTIKKIDIKTWLDTHSANDPSFSTWHSELVCSQEDLEMLFEHDHITGLTKLIAKQIKPDSGIRCFEHLKNQFYIKMGDGTWSRMSSREWTSLVSKISKLTRVAFKEWQEINKELILNDKDGSVDYTGKLQKIMPKKSKVSDFQSRFRSKLYEKMKLPIHQIQQLDIETTTEPE